MWHNRKLLLELLRLYVSFKKVIKILNKIVFLFSPNLLQHFQKFLKIGAGKKLIVFIAVQIDKTKKKMVDFKLYLIQELN